jgi:ABC-2 type transport system permease protein
VRAFLYVASGVAWRYLHNVFTNPALLLPSIIFPLFFLMAFAGGLSAVGNLPGFDFPSGYIAFQYVFALLQASANAGMLAGFTIARDFEEGFARRLLLAAPNRVGIVAGYAAGSLVRAVFTGTVVTVAALVVGMQIDGSGLDLFGLYGLALILNVAGTLWAAGVALRLRTSQAGTLIQTPVFLIIFLAPVYVPLELLEGWIQAVASVNPITFLLEAGRGLISGQPSGVALAFGMGIGLVALFLPWALLGLRRAEKAG